VTRTKNLRNVLIIAVIAALIDLLPNGGAVANVIWQTISLSFLALLAFIGARLYQEHRVTIYSLGPKRRAIAYSALGLATLTLTASDRLLVDPTGTLTWLLLLAVSAYALYAVYRSSREY
jgi:hypothetical protein